MRESALVSAKWLLENYTRPNVKILDASMDATVVFPDAWKSGPEEFEAAHIPGAQFFNIDATSDSSSGLPHTLPTPQGFENVMRSLGVNQDDHVIVYDNSRLRSAARGWWMLRVMGHADVSVLDGGFESWKSAGGPLETGTHPPEKGNFIAEFNPALFRNKSDMLDNITTSTAQVVDARGAPRFAGEVQEPRPGLASGHIPSAKNVPFSTLYETNGALKQAEDLSALFKAANVDVAAAINTSCGSGVTACNLALALFELGNTEVAIYDGSWVEWGSASDVPIETGR